MPSYRELLSATKRQIREVDTATADELRTKPGAVVLDVREPDEFEQGAIPGSLHIPRGQLESNVEPRIPDHNTPVIITCAAGNRSAQATLNAATADCPTGPDTEAPTAPTGLAKTSSTQTSISVSWNPSSDNVGVSAYGAYRDGAPIATPMVTSVDLMKTVAA